MNVEIGATTGVGAIPSNKVVAPGKDEEEKVQDNEVDDLEARMAALGGI